MEHTSPLALLAIFLAFALGGILKGATGAGSPVIAVPVMTAFFDVKLAVAVMIVPNLLTNLMQLWKYRHRRLQGPLPWRFACGGAVGAMLGTWLLVSLPINVLSLLVSGGVVAYIALRFARPDFSLPMGLAQRISLPTGLLAGILQGASGLSAPVSITFLNAIRLERMLFISTISLFFAMMSAAQLPSLVAFGVVTPTTFVLSLAAMVPLVAFMPVGEWLARSVSKEVFDRVLLSLLAGLVLKMVLAAL
jgi:uncharacterized protein